MENIVITQFTTKCKLFCKKNYIPGMAICHAVGVFHRIEGVTYE